jgi:hypothetical protein
MGVVDNPLMKCPRGVIADKKLSSYQSSRIVKAHALLMMED